MTKVTLVLVHETLQILYARIKCSQIREESNHIAQNYSNKPSVRSRYSVLHIKIQSTYNSVNKLNH